MARFWKQGWCSTWKVKVATKMTRIGKSEWKVAIIKMHDVQQCWHLAKAALRRRVAALTAQVALQAEALPGERWAAVQEALVSPHKEAGSKRLLTGPRYWFQPRLLIQNSSRVLSMPALLSPPSHPILVT